MLDQLEAQLAHHLAAAAAPEHRLLTEVAGAVLRDDATRSPLFAGVQVLESIIRGSIEQATDNGEIDERLEVDALVALVLNIYLGAITSKSWGLPQPHLDQVIDVLSAVKRGLELGPDTTS